MSVKKICVIGAGPSGLGAVKQCLDEGLNVVCYDKSDALGGIWRYREEVVNGMASVARTTIANTSKEASAYSDFPPPDVFPHFLDHRHYLKYLEMYAQAFDLERHIIYERQVLKISPVKGTSKWIVSTRNNNGENFSEHFDGVMVATGHHVKPFWPNFTGIEEYKGNLLHSNEYKTAAAFENKTVVVVGCGSSAMDIAVDSAPVAQKVYLSTRRGSWVCSRLGPRGHPWDLTFNRRSLDLLRRMIPQFLTTILFERIYNGYFDHDLYGLKPKHKVFEQHATCNDGIGHCLISQQVTVSPDIERFTSKGLVFKGSNQEIDVDVVVIATGYEIHYSFLDSDLQPTKDEKLNLYKHMFLPHIENPETLAFIGLIQPSGPIVPVSEMQARWFVQLIKGNTQLPKPLEMAQDIETEQDKRRKAFYVSRRHILEAGWISYMDIVSSSFGARPSLWYYFLTDPLLWFHLVFGPCLPYHYRLQGPQNWDQARQTIIDFDRRFPKAFASRTRFFYRS